MSMVSGWHFPCTFVGHGLRRRHPRHRRRPGHPGDRGRRPAGARPPRGPGRPRPGCPRPYWPAEAGGPGHRRLPSPGHLRPRLAAQHQDAVARDRGDPDHRSRLARRRPRRDGRRCVLLSGEAGRHRPAPVHRGPRARPQGPAARPARLRGALPPDHREHDRGALPPGPGGRPGPGERVRRAAHRVPLRRAHRAADLLGPRPRRRGARPRAAGIGAGRAQGHAPVRVPGGAPRRPPHPDRDDLHEHRARRPRGRAARGGPRHHRAQAVAGGAGAAVVHRGVVGGRHRRPHARGPDRELEPGRGAALRLLRGGSHRPLGLADRAAGAARRAARHPGPPAPRSPHQQLRDGVPHQGGPSGGRVPDHLADQGRERPRHRRVLHRARHQRPAPRGAHRAGPGPGRPRAPGHARRRPDRAPDRARGPRGLPGPARGPLRARAHVPHAGLRGRGRAGRRGQVGRLSSPGRRRDRLARGERPAAGGVRGRADRRARGRSGRRALRGGSGPVGDRGAPHGARPGAGRPHGGRRSGSRVFRRGAAPAGRLRRPGRARAAQRPALHRDRAGPPHRGAPRGGGAERAAVADLHRAGAADRRRGRRPPRGARRGGLPAGPGDVGARAGGGLGGRRIGACMPTRSCPGAPASRAWPPPRGSPSRPRTCSRIRGWC